MFAQTIICVCGHENSIAVRDKGVFSAYYVMSRGGKWPILRPRKICCAGIGLSVTSVQV
jgi:hypothetical protein